MSAKSDRMLWCRTLGDVGLFRSEGEEAPLLGASKPVVILAYLGLSPRGSAGRDRIARLLWPSSSAPDARHSLRQALYVLQQAARCVIVDRGSGNELRLVGPIRFDCLEGELALAAGDLERAVGLLNGDFLPHFRVPRSWELAEWIDCHEIRFRNEWCIAARALAAQYLAAGAPERALVIAESLMGHLPFDEPPVRTAMTALVRTGRLSHALSRYEEFRRLLMLEFGVEPTRELQRYAHALELRMEAEISWAPDPEPDPTPLPAPTRLTRT